LHFIDEVEWSWTELDIQALAWAILVVIEAIGGSDRRDRWEEGKNGGDGQCSQTMRHRKLLLVGG
jgi:hypothetical protein